MRRTILVLGTILSILVAACGPASSSGAPSAGASAAPPAEERRRQCRRERRRGLGSERDHRHRRPVRLAVIARGGRGPDPGPARLPGAVPEHQVDYQPIAGDYRDRDDRPSSAAGEVPDLFYVNAEYAPEWIDQGFLAAARRLHRQVAASTPASSSTATSTLQGQGRQDLRLPEGRQHHRAWPTTRDLVTAAARRRWTSWSRPAEALKGTDGLTAPICLNPGLDRGLAFLYAQGGELLTADGTAVARSTPTRPRPPSSGTSTCSRTAWA